jgi:hypothetical protein
VKTIRALGPIIFTVGLVAGHGLGRTNDALAVTTDTSPATADTPVVALDDESANRWSVSAAAYTYFVPDDRNYIQPTMTADRDRLHLEARYNYEDLHTVSAWAGYNFNVGEKLALEFTPMIGGLFGQTRGIAPGYKLSLAYGRLDLYSESEYVLDADDSSENFFYTWSELALSPTDWLRGGLVAQRTKAYETDLDIQRGLLVGVTYERVDLTTYVFNIGRDDLTTVFAVAIHW